MEFLSLTVVSLTPGKTPFAVQLNNNNDNNAPNIPQSLQFSRK
jgi:hypothetical protein